MHLEYQALLQADPELESRLKRLPGATFSGRKRPAKGAHGVFMCYALPALDKVAGEFTEVAGTTRWYLYDLDRDTILEQPGEIVASIRSTPETPRRCTTEERTLVELRAKLGLGREDRATAARAASASLPGCRCRQAGRAAPYPTAADRLCGL